jgi:hypothetical protein
MDSPFPINIISHLPTGFQNVVEFNRRIGQAELVFSVVVIETGAKFSFELRARFDGSSLVPSNGRTFRFSKGIDRSNQNDFR